MNLKWNNFYHPFQQSSLDFLLTDYKNQSFFSDYERLDEIDLYHQPLERPSIVFTFFILKLIIICAGEGICIRLLSSLEKEKGLLKDVTKLFIIVQMILHPTFHCFEIVVNTVYPVNQLFGNWICFLVWLLWGVSGNIVLSYSFISALMRYLFIVHEQKVDTYGKDRVKRWFLYSSTIIPLVQFAIHALQGSPRLSFVNKCYGNDHRIFLFQTSSLSLSKLSFSNLDGPLDDMEIGQEVIAVIGKVVETIWFLFTGFNVAEAFLYFKIFNRLNSDEKKSMIAIRKFLSDASKARRHRRRVLNIQITFLAWLAESIGVLIILLGIFILGHDSNILNFSMQALTMIVYFVLLPSVFLVNDFDIKSKIAESNWYGTILTFFHCNYIKSEDSHSENSHGESIASEQNLGEI